jgi:hypothetical protein
MPQVERGNLRGASALDRAVAAALGDDILSGFAAARAAPPGATARDTAPQQLPPVPGPAQKTNPPPPPAPPAPDRVTVPVARKPKPLDPRRLTAARLLLAGRSVNAVAAELGVHRYTVSRWKSDPRFEAELRRQVAGAAARNTAQQNVTIPRPGPKNEATLVGRPGRPASAAPDPANYTLRRPAAILTGLS